MSGSTQALRSHAGQAPLRAIAFGHVDLTCEARFDGSYLLRSREPLAAHDSSMARLFRAAVARRSDHTFLAERDGDGWRKITYAEARRQADCVAQALMDRGLSAERPVMVLSGNAIEHGILKLACFTAGIPVAPVSVAYSLQSQSRQAQAHRPPADARHDLCRRHRAVREAACRARSRGHRAGCGAQRRESRQRHVVRAARTNSSGHRGRESRRRGQRGHDREIPLHIWVNRISQSRHQHARHDDGEPAADHPNLAIPARRGSGLGGLAAVEPYVRGQSQFQSDHRAGRHALPRRRQAAPRAYQGDRAQSVGGLADDLSQRAGRIRGAAAAS